MSYPVFTILKRDEPLDDIEADGPEDDLGEPTKVKVPHPLNEIEVVGPSPVSTSSVAEWNGVGGDALIIRPLSSFGANEVAPVAALQANYTVTKMGDPEEVRPEITITPAEKARKLQSPEDVFAAEAKTAQTPEKRGPGRPPKAAA